MIIVVFVVGFGSCLLLTVLEGDRNAFIRLLCWHNTIIVEVFEFKHPINIEEATIDQHNATQTNIKTEPTAASAASNHKQEKRMTIKYQRI